MVGFWDRLFGGARQGDGAALLYRGVVARGRDPTWYVEGGVADTIDGRFDMIAALLSLVLLRLEAEGEAARRTTVRLAEQFVDDMEGSLREIGIGDLAVGKHVTRMMGALGGRLGAFRETAAGDGDFAEPVRRNIFHEAPPSPAALAFVAERLRDFHAALAALPLASIAAGELPAT